MPLYVPSAAGTILVEEEDGAPSVSATKIEVTNGTLTDDGGGTVSIATGAGSGTFSGAKALSTAATTMTDGTETVVPYAATDEYDTDAYHDTASNNTRLTVVTGKAGKYRITAEFTLASAAYLNVYGALRKNANGVAGAGTILALQSASFTNSSGSTSLFGQIHADVVLAEADYVELFVNQTSGANRALRTGAGENWLAWQFLGA